MTAIVTNIDADHMATYEGDFGKLRQTFIDFLHHLPFYGLAVLCYEDPVIREMLPQVGRPFLTYGVNEEADVRAVEIQQTGLRSTFNVIRPGRVPLPITLNLPGFHNVLNSLAAIAVATEVGVEDAAIQRALATFQGIGRRFQIYGEIVTHNGSITLVDDYGHHPREIAATLQAARSAYPEKRLVLAFQPHRYTRTRDLFEDFSEVLSTVDALVVLEVYAAGEKPIAGADSRTLCRAIRARGLVDPVFVASAADLDHTLIGVITDGDLVVTMGAGDIGYAAPRLAESLAVQEKA